MKNFEEQFLHKDKEAIPLGMYEVSGQDSINQHTFERYLKDKKQDEAIQSQVEKSTPFLVQKIRLIFDKTYRSNSEIIPIIIESLDNPNVEIQKVAIAMIWTIPKNERAPILKKCFENKNIEIQKTVASVLEYVSEAEESDRLFLFRKALHHSDVEIRKISVSKISSMKYAADKLQILLLEEALADPDEEVRKLAVDQIRHIQKKEGAVILVEKALNDQSIEVQKEAANNIEHCTPKENQPSLRKIVFENIQKSINDPNIEIQKNVSDMIAFAPEKDRAVLVDKLLDSLDFALQTKAFDLIYYVPESEKVALTQKATDKLAEFLKNKDIEIIKKSIRLISIAPDNRRADFLKDMLNHENINIQEEAAEVIWYPTDDQERKMLIGLIARNIKKSLNNSNIEIQKKGLDMLKVFGHYSGTEEETELLLNMVSEKGLSNELVKPPLYDKNTVTKENFSRQNFEKTGSKTTLLGGNLKEKSIIRHIEPGAFLEWQKLYEDYHMWKENGFDYVPIEPIQSYNLNKEGFVDVYSGILDLNLEQWEKITRKFSPDLGEQKKKLLSILESKKIEHGHVHHDRNFCLRFFRDKNGNVNLSKTPRLYLIDLDMVTSS